MTVVTVFTTKGGVGKTTVTANLGAEWARRGYDVLLVDADPQGSLTLSFVWPELWRTHLQDAGRTLAPLVLGRRAGASPDPMASHDDLGAVVVTPEPVEEALAEHPDTGRLDLVAASPALVDADIELAPRRDPGTLRLLGDLLARPPASDYDVVLIDTAPHVGVLSRMALLAADTVLVPSRPDYLSTQATSGLQRHLRGLARDGADPVVAGVVLTMVAAVAGTPVRSARTYAEETARLGYRVFDTWLRERRSHYAELTGTGVPLVLSPYARHRDTVENLRALTDELTDRLPRPTTTGPTTTGSAASGTGAVESPA